MFEFSLCFEAFARFVISAPTVHMCVNKTKGSRCLSNIEPHILHYKSAIDFLVSSVQKRLLRCRVYQAF